MYSRLYLLLLKYCLHDLVGVFPSALLTTVAVIVSNHVKLEKPDRDEEIDVCDRQGIGLTSPLVVYSQRTSRSATDAIN